MDFVTDRHAICGRHCQLYQHELCVTLISHEVLFTVFSATMEHVWNRQRQIGAHIRVYFVISEKIFSNIMQRVSRWVLIQGWITYQHGYKYEDSSLRGCDAVSIGKLGIGNTWAEFSCSSKINFSPQEIHFKVLVCWYVLRFISDLTGWKRPIFACTMIAVPFFSYYTEWGERTIEGAVCGNRSQTWGM